MKNKTFYLCCTIFFIVSMALSCNKEVNENVTKHGANNLIKPSSNSLLLKLTLERVAVEEQLIQPRRQNRKNNLWLTNQSAINYFCLSSILLYNII